MQRDGSSFRQIYSLADETTEQMKQLAQQIQSTTEKLEETLQSANQVLREYDQLIGWAETYDHCIFEAKKMIVAQFVKAVHVRRDYEIDIEFSVSFEKFQALYLERGAGGSKEARNRYRFGNRNKKVRQAFCLPYCWWSSPIKIRTQCRRDLVK